MNMTKAAEAEVQQERNKLRELKKKEAMEMLGKAPYHNFFKSIEGDDFEDR